MFSNQVSKTYLELLVAIFDNHIIATVDRTKPHSQSIPHCFSDQFRPMCSGEEESGEDDREIRIAMIVKYGPTARSTADEGDTPAS